MSISIPQPTDMCIITTYRCPMRCKMCNIWEHPTDKRKEITPEEIKLLPSVKFINLTGGEPFIREDLDQIVEVCFTKSPRVVISTSCLLYTSDAADDLLCLDLGGCRII